MSDYPADPDPTDRECDCCETQFQNTADQSIQWSNLMEHGIWLDACETLCVPGNIWAFIAAAHPGIKGKRYIRKLASQVCGDEYGKIISYPGEPCGSSSSCIA